jgi:hypothetical protein
MREYKKYMITSIGENKGKQWIDMKIKTIKKITKLLPQPKKEKNIITRQKPMALVFNVHL